MARKTRSSLQTQFDVIRNETEKWANTTVRVADAHQDALDSLFSLDDYEFGLAIPNWQAGSYFRNRALVNHPINNIIYELNVDTTSQPFESSDIDAEIVAGQWVKFFKLGIEITVDVGGEDVGGALHNQTFAKDTPLDTMWATLLTKRIAPTYQEPEISLNDNGAQNNIEVGVLISSIVFTPSFAQNDAGQPINFVFNEDGSPIFTQSGSPVAIQDITKSGLQMINDSFQYQAQITYEQGAVKNDNLGDSDPTGQILAGTISSNIITFTGLYPFLVGMVNVPGLTGTNFYSDPNLTKITNTNGIVGQGNKNVLLNGTNKYITFAYPSLYPDLSSVLDQNGFEILSGTFGNFTLVTVESVGLNQNYTREYKVYQSGITTVNNATFQFKF